MAMPISPGPPLVVGKPSLLFRGEFALLQGKNYDVTRDGQRFLMVQTVEREQPRTVSVVLNWLAEFAVRRLAINYCQRASTFANACCWLPPKLRRSSREPSRDGRYRWCTVRLPCARCANSAALPQIRRDRDRAKAR
jgi:hypothetical protein